MTSPAIILVGEVNMESVRRNLDEGNGITFQKPLGFANKADWANAVLVVLEPEQSPAEAAETILWALR